MDQTLNALVNLDVPADVVRIDVQGSLTHDSRAGLLQIIRRIRRMGIRSHIRVELSRAALVESSALAGLRSDLNAIDNGILQGIHGSGVSLDLSPATDEWMLSPNEETLTMIEGISADPTADLYDIESAAALSGFDEAPRLDLPDLGAWGGRALQEYSDDELLLASDTLFSLLDNPGAFAGSDLMGRYEDIGREITRRQQDTASPFPLTEGQAAS
ncbi:hypothetical protein QF038_003573 [Pseudarthrobacter sp. W1I19]|uniref:hypothetical protein n=1 Tax=Pseudarthrobacter sp. W1I19 TaxID=3042288 RepID=UPI002788C20C|nr:hypothetical protein [Pseudarthrobacter sp. W1I19]MDQ0925065.1 hypothetical protein [Pseudarthrobacter sp. W1I19]